MVTVFNSFVEHYQKSLDQDTLALALQTFEKLQTLHLKPTPIHYTLIFEYFAQIDTTFASQIENAINLDQYNDVTAEILFFDLISTIFKKHLPNDAFSKVLKDLLLSLNHWEIDAIKNQQKLKSEQQTLIDLKAPDHIQDHMAQNILPTIDTILAQNATLKTDLIATQKELRNLQHQLNNASEIARTDELTGLLNRRGFNQAITHLIQEAEAERQTFCLLIIDIDKFKIINDQHGHLIGDAVLRYLAKVIKNEIKGKDIAARIGGEEFAILLPETYFSDAHTLAEGFRKKVCQNALQDRQNQSSIKVSVSIGVGIYQMGEDKDCLIERADKALYHAKTHGRNRVCTEADI